VDVAHGNVRELCEFTDGPDLPAALERLIEWGAGAVVVHLGAQGAGYYDKNQWLLEPPPPAVQPLHSTGCGDVLSVCMILLHGRTDLSIRDRLRLSNRVVREFMEGRRTFIPVLQP
jgi:sugar/nucleoside kinase (ribokinase family)